MNFQWNNDEVHFVLEWVSDKSGAVNGEDLSDGKIIDS
jgi:hypothetical protein